MRASSTWRQSFGATKAFGETHLIERLRICTHQDPPHPSTPRGLTDWGNDCGEVVPGTVESKAEQTTAVVSFDPDEMYMMAAWEALCPIVIR
jgi:hypothetical protein